MTTKIDIWRSNLLFNKYEKRKKEKRKIETERFISHIEKIYIGYLVPKVLTINIDFREHK